MLWFFIIALIITVLILSGLLFWSVSLNLKYSEKIEEIKDVVDESLDVLNLHYQRAARRAKLEVMSDEPVVRELVSDLQSARNVILLVANLIVGPFKDDENDDESDE